MVVTPPAGVAAEQITVDVPAGAASDGAGNASLAAARDAQPVDTLAPTRRVAGFVVNDNVAPRAGTLAPGETTNDNTPTVTMTLDAVLGAGEVLTLTRNGGTVAAVTTGPTLAFADGPQARGGTSCSDAATIVGAAGNGTLLDLDGTLPGSFFTFAVA
jgi:hypothetical protein